MTRRSSKKKNSCLNIISCGRGSSAADKDDVHLEQSDERKHSTDKRGWSFRKRSERHQVLNNDIITDTPSPRTNANPEPTTFKLHAQTDPVLPEKLSVLQWPGDMPTGKQDEVNIPKENEVTIKEQDEVMTMRKEDEVTTQEQDEMTSRKENEPTTKEDKDEVTIIKESEVTTKEENDEGIRKEDEVTTKEEDQVTIEKEDEVTTKEEDQVTIEKEDEVTTKEDHVTIEKEDEVTTSLDAVNQIPDTLVAQENTIKINPIVSTENASQIDSLTTLEDASTVDLNVEESIAIVLQAAIRGYLAKRALLKHRSVIKLQAAVRGHLVRDQAVGTLRCVQAIVKMQALVRARRARSLEDLSVEEKLDGKEKNQQGPLVNPSSGVAGKANTHYSSTQKLLSNGFARLLLESTPKKKKIHVKCDPSRPDSSWKWFDRWTSVSSSKFTQPKKSEFNPDLREHGEMIDDVSCGVETEIPAEVIYESADLSTNIRDMKMPADSEENSITYYADNFDFHGSHLNSCSRNDNIEQPWPVDDAWRKEQEFHPKVDMNQTEMQLDTVSQTMHDSTLNEPREDIGQIKHSSLTTATEEPNTEGKKSSFVSRKASNPAFLAAQSKFEDLSLRTISGRSISSTYQDVGLETRSDKLSSPADSVPMDKEHSSITENSISYDIISECGTELSISSTLDSPDRSEVGDEEFVTEAMAAEKVVSDINSSADNASNLGNLGANEAKVAEPVVSNVNGSTDHAEEVVSDKNGSMDHAEEVVSDMNGSTDHAEEVVSDMNGSTDDAEKVVSDMNDSIDYASSLGNQGVDAENDSTLLEPISPHTVSVLPEKVEDVASESNGSFVAVETPCTEQLQERAASDVQIQLDTKADLQEHQSSVEGSPVTHTTAPESHDTPSSQVSVKAKKKKLGKSVSPQIRKSPSASKKSPAQPSPDSGARSSTEQLPKEPRIGKRRISFGSAKTDHVELEPKDSSSISLPSYMQATQSARLKAHSNNSPKSRPDVQEKDTIIKKRHSLPGANGKHGSSPRVVQQLASQKQQSPNGNLTQTPW